MVYSAIIIGAKGFLGRHFYQYLQVRCSKTIGTHYQPAENLFVCDLYDPKIELPTEGYTYALITAGIANPYVCEKDPQRSYLCNVTGTLKLGEMLLKHGVIPVFFSSEHVFDGLKDVYYENEPTSPLNQYGKQKAECEQLAMMLPEALVIRTGKVYGLERGDHTLFDEMASQLSTGETILAANDQFFSPICIADLIKGVDSLLSQGRRGIINASGSSLGSRYEMACEVAKNLGYPTSRVRPISIDHLSDGVRRPKRVVLNSAFPSISWQEGCRKVCENYL